MLYMGDNHSSTLIKKLKKDHVAQMATYGYGYTAIQLVHLAIDTARFLQLRDSLKPLSKKWYQGFMKRWPEVRLVKARG